MTELKSDWILGKISYKECSSIGTAAQEVCQNHGAVALGDMVWCHDGLGLDLGMLEVFSDLNGCMKTDK